MILVILGVPGSGKGTQAELLKERKGFSHISTGDLLRNLKDIPNPDDQTKEALAIMARGGLVSDDFVFMTTAAAVDQVVEEGKDVILDGVVRTPVQAEMFWQHFDRKGWADKVQCIEISLSDDDAWKRVEGRMREENREDDDPQVAKARFAAMGNSAVEPLRSFYENKGVFKEVDGLGSVEEVYDRIIKAL